MNDTFIDLSPAELAAKYINQTHRSVFLTGKAGTGKTTFLRNVIECTHKNAIIVAPTGIAAINAGGVTIHSQFGLQFGLFVPDSSYKIDATHVKVNTPTTVIKQLHMREKKRQLLQELELLVIDEVSMLRADLLDVIDLVLRSVRRQSHKPFGGVQVLFIGDLMQLPPVVKEDEWQILKHYYNSIYFFEAKVLKQEMPIYIELDKIYRQSDNTFIDLLNNLRNNKITQANIELLNTYYKPNFDALSALNTITLTTHNNKADTLNKSRLLQLTQKSYFFKATIDGEFNEYAYPVDANLELKVGAQIMFIKNDPNPEKLYYNGKIGVISKLTEKDIEVDLQNGTKPFLLERYQWKNIKYELSAITNQIEEIEVGHFEHYPIKLAWAITVHKSQGLTFENAILDINYAFAPGQAYVALSRLKSLNGLVLTNPIKINAIEQEKSLVQYSETKTDKKELALTIQNETKQFLKSLLIKTYDFNPLSSFIKNHFNSYTIADIKTNKQKFQPWASQLVEKIEGAKQHAETFLNQLHAIFESSETDYLQKLSDRNNAAKNYFTPLLKDVSKTILLHIEHIKNEKQIKIYLTELLEVENLVYKYVNQLTKTTLVIDTIIHQKEFSKKELQKVNDQTDRVNAVRQTIEIAYTNREDSTTNTTKKTPKSPKPDTKEVTYNLYKTGKTIKEIANERSLTVSTIEGHLAHYVELGIIPVSNFLSNEDYMLIKDSIKKYETNVSASVREELGSHISYTDIKFVYAGLKAEEKNTLKQNK